MFNRKIAIIVFFFGKLPWYFNFFLKSCSCNPSINFLFFTDNSAERFNVPPNFTFVKFSLEDFNALASEKLQLPIAIKKGYKVCDLRPAFGVIFKEYINGYEFWGYADIDIILGRIREFMTEDVLNEYDILCVKDEYPTGYFTILRNNETINNLFRKSRDYEMVFLSPGNFLFEECGGYYTEVCTGMNILDTACPFETFYHVIEKEKETVRTLFDYFVIERTPGRLKWENGLLSYRAEFEIILYHLSDYKINVFARFKHWKKIPDIYYIDKYNFRRTNAFFPAIVLLWTDRLLPALIKNSCRLLMSLCEKIYKKSYNNLAEGNYVYMNETLIIKKEKDKSYLLFGNAEKKYNLLKFPFTTRYFFNSFTQNIYRRDGENFAQIFKDGNIVAYSFGNNHT